MGTTVEKGKRDMIKTVYPYLKELLAYIDFIEIYDDAFMMSEYSKFVENILGLMHRITGSEVIALSFFNRMQEKFTVEKILKKGEYKSYFSKFELDKEELEIEGHYFQLEDYPDLLAKNIDLKNLKTSIIIPLRRNEVFGFLSLSQTTVFDEIEDNSLNELFEAIAILFGAVLNNKAILEQYDALDKKLMLNNTLFDTIYNIQMSQNLESFYKNLRNTLSIVYKMKKLFIMQVERDDQFKVVAEKGINQKDLSGTLIQSVEELNQGIVYSFSGKKINQYFTENFIEELGENNCFVMASLDEQSYMVSETKETPKYVICILEVERGLKNEHVVLVENFFKVLSTKHQELLEKEIKKNYNCEGSRNDADILIADVKEKIYDYDNYSIDFFIHYCKLEEIIDADGEGYIVGKYHFNVGFDPHYNDNYQLIERPKSIDEFINVFNEILAN